MRHHLTNTSVVLLPLALFGTACFAASGQVRTPDGLFPAACVHDVGNNAVVSSSGHVTYADGSDKLLEGCSLVRRPASTTPVNYTPPDSWVMDSIWASPVPAIHMTSTFIVPSVPTTAEGQTVFLFPGMRPADGSSVLQPVLQWGNGTPSWEAASWACAAISGGACPHSNLIDVKPGDEMFGEIIGTNCSAAGACTWNITTTDKTTGQTTTLTSTDDARVYTLLFGGVLESYDITKCGDYPANGSAVFPNVNFYDAQGTLLVPDYFAQYDITSICKMSMKVTPTATELDFPTAAAGE